LKQSKHQDVLSAIRKRLPIDFEEQQESKKSKKKSKKELSNEKLEETPVEKCYRYIMNRQNNLDYKSAIENELPIGSGEIESGHRYEIQKRLKIAGAWWKPETAEYMLCLRTLRANGDWDRYWNNRKAA
jgi:hypothetical protein